MTEGEKILMLREHERTLEVMGQRLTAMERQMEKAMELLKSPIQRAVFAAKQGREIGP